MKWSCIYSIFKSIIGEMFIWVVWIFGSQTLVTFTYPRSTSIIFISRWWNKVIHQPSEILDQSSVLRVLKEQIWIIIHEQYLVDEQLFAFLYIMMAEMGSWKCLEITKRGLLILSITRWIFWCLLILTEHSSLWMGRTVGNMVLDLSVIAQFGNPIQ